MAITTLYSPMSKPFCEAPNGHRSKVPCGFVRGPCLPAALWCGNNEIEQGFINWEGNSWTDTTMPLAEYGKIFDECLPQVLREEDGITAYNPLQRPHTRQKPLQRARCHRRRRALLECVVWRRTH